jgi:iron complex transport system substrate-binding protein
MKFCVFLFLFSLVFVNACSSLSVLATPVADLNGRNPLPIEVVDALGRNVILAKPPSRIVMNGVGLIMTQDAAYMFPEAPNRIAAMGMANQGHGNFVSILDADYEKKAIFQIEASAEQMAAVNPDLVILKSYLAGKVGKAIEQLGIPVLYLDFETPDNYSRDLAILGKVFQNQSRAQELIDFYSSRVGLIQKTLNAIKEKPRVLLLYYGEKNGAVAFNIPPQTWIQTEMVKRAGGDPVWESTNTGQGWQVVTLEQIAAWDADHILIVSYLKNSAEIVAELKANPEWKQLRAVKEGRLDGFPADFYSWDQSDARWILGLSWLSARLHPALFPSYDVIQDAKDFFRVLYHVDDQLFDAKIRPVLRGKLN